MKRTLTLGLIGWFIATLGSIRATAQEIPAPPPPPPPPPGVTQKSSQEIVITQKDDKDTKLTVEITDGKVKINGKPLAEFKEDGVTINNRKMIVRDGNKILMDINGKMTDLNSAFDLDRLQNFSSHFSTDNFSFGTGSKEYTYLGVTTTKTEQGAKVTGVTKDSPAEKAGLQKDDIIYKIGSTEIDNTNSLSSVIREKKDGDKVKVYFLRDGKKKDEKVTLTTTKTLTVQGYRSTGRDGSIKTLTVPRKPLSPELYNRDYGLGEIQITGRRPKLGLKIQDTEESTGVKILDVEAASASATAGLMKDDIITEIGGTKVTNTDEARLQLQQNQDKSNYVVKAKRNGVEMTFTIKIPKNLKTVNL